MTEQIWCCCSLSGVSRELPDGWAHAAVRERVLADPAVDAGERSVCHQSPPSRLWVPAQIVWLQLSGHQQSYPSPQTQWGVRPPQVSQVCTTATVRDLRLMDSVAFVHMVFYACKFWTSTILFQILFHFFTVYKWHFT